MKKYLLSLFALVLMNQLAFSQGGWQRLYPIFSGGLNGDGIEAVRQTADGGYIMAGISDHNSGAHNNRVVKVNDLGAIQWSNSYTSVNNYSWATNIEIAPTGGYYVEGHRNNPVTYKDEVYIQRLDVNGNELWVNFYPQATISTKGSVTNDGGYVAICYDLDNLTNMDSVAIIKINASGTLNWVKKYPSGSIGIPHAVIQTMSGEYVVEGFKNYRAFLCKFDAIGDTIWHNLYGIQNYHPEYIGKVIENTDGSYTVASNDALTQGNYVLYMYKTDANGLLIWEQHYNQPQSVATDIAHTSDGGYIMVGMKNMSGSVKIVLIKTDALGNQQWLKIYDGNGAGAYKAYSVRQTSDGGYIVGGAKVSSFYTRKNMYLIKTDELGEIYSNTLQGYVYDDINTNCTLDTGEYHLANRIIEVAGSQSYWTSTNQDGYYWVRVDTGNYNVILHPQVNANYWQNSTCSNDTIALSIPNQLTTIDTSFAMNANAYCPLLTVSLSTPFLRRCFPGNYYLSYINNGTAVAQNAYIDVDFDSYLIIDTANITVPWSLISANVYRFTIGDVGIGGTGAITIPLLVSCNSILGQTLCSSASIYPTSNCLFPTWTGAVIAANASCQADSVVFNLSNSGANASSVLHYTIYADTAIANTGTFTLAAGQSTDIVVPSANGVTYILVAQQEQGYPAVMGDSLVSIAIEGCGGSVNGGIVTQFSNYDGSPFLDIDCRPNIGAYDPNDKIAFPAGYGANHYIYSHTVLDYQIRFQNTGTDTAFTVVVRDTISNYLDLASIELGSSSHPYSMFVHGDGVQVIDFIFNNIQLPDSNVNEAASHGFVQFKIKQKTGNAIGTVIKNNAGIYFDFNEAVITNTTFHQIGENFIPELVTYLPKSAMQKSSVTVYPNPSSSAINFVINQTSKQSGINYLTVYNTTGDKVLETSANSNKITIEKGSLPAGLYFYKVMNNNGLVGSGKVIVQQ